MQLRCSLSDSGCCHHERSRYTVSHLGCCLNMVLARANSCSKQKSSCCSPASFVSPKPYSPAADDIADGSLLPTLALKSPIMSSMSPCGYASLQRSVVALMPAVLLLWQRELCQLDSYVNQSLSPGPLPANTNYTWTNACCCHQRQ